MEILGNKCSVIPNLFASVDSGKFADLCFKSIPVCSTRTLVELTQIVVAQNDIELPYRLALLTEVVNKCFSIIKQPELEELVVATACESLVLAATNLKSFNEKTGFERICIDLKAEILKLKTSLSNHEDTKDGTIFALNFLKALITLTAENVSNTDATFDIICTILRKGNSATTAFIMIHIIPLISQPNILKEIWEIAWKLFQEPTEDGPGSEKLFSMYVLMCCLCDISFTSHCEFALQDEVTFWQVVQYGLVNRHASLRKRSMYALKRALEYCDTSGKNVKCVSHDELVFYWDPKERTSLNEKWEDILLLLEVLEEKQVHVLKPALVKMNSLIQCVTKDTVFSWLLSWLLVVYRRMLTHETKFMIRWSVSSILGLRFQDVLQFSRNIVQFVCTNFLSALNIESIYQRAEAGPSHLCVPAGQDLTDFLRHMTDIVSDSGEFIRTLVSHICQGVDTWGGVALFHLTRSLSQLTPAPVLTITNVEDIGNLVRNSLRSQEPLLRGAIQCNVLTLVLRLADPAELNLSKLSQFLTVLKKSECFQRGTAQWAEVVRWLQQHFKAADNKTNAFLSESLHALLRGEDLPDIHQDNHCHSDSEYRRIARMFILMDDAELVDSSRWLELLQEPIDWLLTAHSRPYLSKRKLENALGLCTWILKEGEALNVHSTIPDSGKVPSVCETILKHISTSVLDFLDWLIKKSLQSQDLGEVHLYLNAWKILGTQDVFESIASSKIFPAFEKCCDILQLDFAIPMFLCSWHALSSCWSLLEKTKCCHSSEKAAFLLAQLVTNGQLDQLINKPRKLCRSPEEKLLSSSAMQQAWIVYSKFSNRATFLTPDVASELATLATKSFQTASHSAAISIFNALQIVLKNVMDPQLVEKSMKVGWQTCLEMRKNDMFRPTLSAFVAAFFQPWLMISHTQLLLDKFLELRDLGETSTGLFPILVRHCLLIWTDPDHFQTSLPFVLMISSALTFGVVHRKDQRVVSDTTEFIVSLGTSLAVNSLIQVDVYPERSSRALTLAFLSGLSASNHSHVTMCCHLVDLLVAKDKEVSFARSRHFGNSLVHRVKNRCWQALILFLPLLDQPKSEYLLKQAYESMTEECQQPSVRYLQEWLVARILMRWPDLQSQLIPEMESAAESRLGCAGSFLAVMVHLSSCSETVTLAAEEEPQFRCWLRGVLPWCMAQHFNTRLYARAAWLRLWKRAEDLGLESLVAQYRDLRECLLSQKECGNTSKNVKLLTEDFYYTSFKADLHYSLETIFYEMPRLTHTSADEWIEPDVFRKCFRVLSQSGQEALVPLLNQDRSLEEATPANWMPSTFHTRSEEEEEDELGDHFQKKITPWTQMGVGCSSERGARPTSHGGLVVVATLIDKVPNLGGLCRTCEVFGASLYVLPSLRHTQDKQFTGLSVTAEKWIPIKEVTPNMLKPYLLEMKSLGYTLVGVEQTTQSTDLTKFTFPKDTLLLLGNEREGLPVDLIHLLDVCVEIPQQGVVRSLNVHVSGALLIWEYSRQHLVAVQHATTH